METKQYTVAEINHIAAKFQELRQSIEVKDAENLRWKLALDKAMAIMTPQQRAQFNQVIAYQTNEHQYNGKCKIPLFLYRAIVGCTRYALSRKPPTANSITIEQKLESVTKSLKLARRKNRKLTNEVAVVSSKLSSQTMWNSLVSAMNTKVEFTYLNTGVISALIYFFYPQICQIVYSLFTKGITSTLYEAFNSMDDTVDNTTNAGLGLWYGLTNALQSGIEYALGDGTGDDISSGSETTKTDVVKFISDTAKTCVGCMDPHSMFAPLQSSVTTMVQYTLGEVTQQVSAISTPAGVAMLTVMSKAMSVMNGFVRDKPTEWFNSLEFKSNISIPIDGFDMDDDAYKQFIVNDETEQFIASHCLNAIKEADSIQTTATFKHVIKCKAIFMETLYRLQALPAKFMGFAMYFIDENATSEVNAETILNIYSMTCTNLRKFKELQEPCDRSIQEITNMVHHRGSTEYKLTIHPVEHVSRHEMNNTCKIDNKIIADQLGMQTTHTNASPVLQIQQDSVNKSIEVQSQPVSETLVSPDTINATGSTTNTSNLTAPTLAIQQPEFKETIQPSIQRGTVFKEGYEVAKPESELYKFAKEVTKNTLTAGIKALNNTGTYFAENTAARTKLTYRRWASSHVGYSEWLLAARVAALAYGSYFPVAAAATAASIASSTGVSDATATLAFNPIVAGGTVTLGVAYGALRFAECIVDSYRAKLPVGDDPLSIESNLNIPKIGTKKTNGSIQIDVNMELNACIQLIAMQIVQIVDTNKKASKERLAQAGMKAKA